MLAKNLSDAEKGKIIYFSGGSNFSNPNYEFKAKFIGIKGYRFSLSADLEFDGYIEDEIALRAIPDQIKDCHICREIYVSLDEIYARKKGETKWRESHSNSRWEGLPFDTIVEFSKVGP